MKNKIGVGKEIKLFIKDSTIISVRSESFRGINSDFLDKEIKLSNNYNKRIKENNANEISSLGVTDIDGNNYRTVVIGNQEWMAENLRTTRYANGNSIQQVTSSSTWQNLTSGAYCWYNNNSNYENPYGKLYNWYAVNDSRNVCPSGWHVPSDAEWTTLENYISSQGYSNNPGTALKATSGWQSNGNGTDVFGFSGLPGGNRNSSSGIFINFGYYGIWWSSSEDDKESAWSLLLLYGTNNVTRSHLYKENGFSVRCLRD